MMCKFTAYIYIFNLTRLTIAATLKDFNRLLPGWQKATKYKNPEIIPGF
jgi:hypothetical protein